MSDQNKYDDKLALASMAILSASWLSLDSNDSLLLKIIISSLMIFVTSLMFRGDSRYAIVALFLVGLCLRFHYLSFVGFSHVPYGDAQIDLFMANVLLENEQITFIHHEIYDDRLLYYSSWPLSQICVVVFTNIAGTENIISTHFMQFALYFSCFLIAYRIATIFNNSILNGESRNIRWAILLFVCLPELNYWQGEYVRLNLGVLASFFMAYSLILMASPKYRLESSILLILSCIMLGFSHNLTTAISVLTFFLAISIMFLISYRDGSIREENNRSFLNAMVNNLALLSVIAIIWWSLVGEVLFPKIQGVVGRYSTILIEGFSLTHDPRIPTPAELSPSWALFFLLSRDALILLSTAFGFILLSRKYLGKSNINFNLLFSFSISYFLVFLTLFLWAEPFRVLTYASPFMSVCMAYCLTNTEIWKNGHDSNLIHSTILIVILVGSFISPNTHTHAPMFFYDEELNDIEYGLPGSNARGAILFTIEKTDPNSSISTDHPDYSIHPLGPSDVTRFTSLVQDLVQDESGNVSYKPSTEIVLLIRGGGIFQLQSAQSTNSSFIDFTEKSGFAITEKLQNTGNLVYDQGDGVSVWIIPS